MNTSKIFTYKKYIQKINSFCDDQLPESQQHILPHHLIKDEHIAAMMLWPILEIINMLSFMGKKENHRQISFLAEYLLKNKTEKQKTIKNNKTIDFCQVPEELKPFYRELGRLWSKLMFFISEDAFFINEKIVINFFNSIVKYISTCCVYTYFIRHRKPINYLSHSYMMKMVNFYIMKRFKTILPITLYFRIFRYVAINEILDSLNDGRREIIRNSDFSQSEFTQFEEIPLVYPINDPNNFNSRDIDKLTFWYDTINCIYGFHVCRQDSGLPHNKSGCDDFPLFFIVNPMQRTDEDYLKKTNMEKLESRFHGIVFAPNKNYDLNTVSKALLISAQELFESKTKIINSWKKFIERPFYFIQNNLDKYEVFVKKRLFSNARNFILEFSELRRLVSDIIFETTDKDIIEVIEDIRSRLIMSHQKWYMPFELQDILIEARNEYYDFLDKMQENWKIILQNKVEFDEITDEKLVATIQKYKYISYEDLMYNICHFTLGHLRGEGIKKIWENIVIHYNRPNIPKDTFHYLLGYSKKVPDTMVKKLTCKCIEQNSEAQGKLISP